MHDQDPTNKRVGSAVVRAPRNDGNLASALVAHPCAHGYRYHTEVPNRAEPRRKTSSSDEMPCHKHQSKDLPAIERPRRSIDFPICPPTRLQIRKHDQSIDDDQ